MLTTVCLQRGSRGLGVPGFGEAEPPEGVLTRKSFPPGFVFGTGSSAYQTEGAWNQGGKGPSIWDIFTHRHPEYILDTSNGDIAVDFYNRYKEYVKLLKDIGVNAYKFSISWPRLLPGGTLRDGINQGVQYYNNLINELKKNDIDPYVTLFHWDVPQALEEEYEGFLNRRIVDDFKDYCEICFNEFGDRVKHWVTINEPRVFTQTGYRTGESAPNRCSKSLGCSVGNSSIEPYIASHNLILAHAEATILYKKYYQAKQGGMIGIALDIEWFEPYTKTFQNLEAVNRAFDFALGWYMDPLVYGDYPFSMKAILRDRLPCFTKQESERIKGSCDFFSINYYTASYARGQQFTEETLDIPENDGSFVELRGEREDGPIGFSNRTFIYGYPKGIKELLFYIEGRFNRPTIYITENGLNDADRNLPTIEDALKDTNRMYYISRHLAEICEALREGVDVRGYFTWSFTDDFEWVKGYTDRFGLIYIDYKDDLKPYMKDSAKWLSKFLSQSS